jgi:hypothetical protein
VSDAPIDRRPQAPPSSPVSGALRLYGRHWRTLAACALVGVVPVALLDATNYLQTGIDPFAGATTSEADPAAASTLSWLGLGLSFALYSLVTAACIGVVAESREGRAVGWREALSRGASRTVPVLLASLIVTIGVGFGLLALVLPGIWLAVSWSVASPAVVLEDASPLQAVRRSFGLVRGSWWYALAVLALGALTAIAILIAVAIPVALIIQAVDDQVARVILYALTETVVTVIVLPFGAALVALLYFELRSREEPAQPVYGPPGGDGRFRGFEPPAAPASS